MSNPLKISEFIGIINDQLENFSADIIGEVYERNIAASGHVYFTLKDKETGDILPCVMWKGKYAYAGVELEIGLEVMVRGKPNFNGRFGKFSFITDQIELVGEGALKKAYEKLKAKLEAEGLFARERKRPLPKFPKRIGVITSVQGAVIHDFNNNLRRSGMTVKILDCRVEGAEAGRPLALSVKAMRSQDLDVLVIIRGGGSMQSLSGYNNEALIREVANFPVPVITGVGHHQDVPLVCLVADATQSTPSLAATLVSSSWSEAEYGLNAISGKIFAEFQNVFEQKFGIIDQLESEMKNFFNKIIGRYNRAIKIVKNGSLRLKFRLKQLDAELAQAMKNNLNSYQNVIKTARAKILNFEKIIELNNPKRQLGLGYSIAFAGEKIVRSIKGLSAGENISILVQDGKIISEIKKLS